MAAALLEVRSGSLPTQVGIPSTASGDGSAAAERWLRPASRSGKRTGRATDNVHRSLHLVAGNSAGERCFRGLTFKRHRNSKPNVTAGAGRSIGNLAAS